MSLKSKFSLALAIFTIFIVCCYLGIFYSKALSEKVFITYFYLGVTGIVTLAWPIVFVQAVRDKIARTVQKRGRGR